MNDIRQGTIAALVAGGALVLAGLAPPGARAIVGGERVASAQAPWAASLVSAVGSRRAHTCSATVVGPRRLVTARHCVEHADLWQDRVVVGSDAPERAPGDGVAIARVWAPVLIDELRGNIADSDLAVIETARDLGAPALPLAAAGFVAAPGEPVHAYGFGASDRDYARDEPALLRRAAMRMHTPAECGESDFGDSPTAICAERDAGPGGGNVSYGDSGGGLVRQGAHGPELLGVNSVITAGMLRDEIAGFASVPALRAFLDAPERGYELPRPLAPARLRGAARVGERVRCEVRWSLPVKRRDVVWRLRRRGSRERRIERRATVAEGPARRARLAAVVRGVGLAGRLLRHDQRTVARDRGEAMTSDDDPRARARRGDGGRGAGADGGGADGTIGGLRRAARLRALRGARPGRLGVRDADRAAGPHRRDARHRRAARRSGSRTTARRARRRSSTWRAGRAARRRRARRRRDGCSAR